MTAWLREYQKTLVLGLTLMLGIVGHTPLIAQGGFYDSGKVQEIRLSIPRADWRPMLDSLMKAGNDSIRLGCDVEINGVKMKGAGVRFKGFSSWNQGAVKNPFNIELDYLIKYRNYEGYTKLRLSNVIHDPSFLREALSYDIARQYMPASGANFANLWVNDTVIGLYSNVESVDEHFMEKQFGNSGYALLKGSPEKLVFPFGQNANLAWHGSDSSAYFPYYELISETGWNALVAMIDLLNNDPEHVGSMLNVDQVLWMHALNYAMVNLDSYIGYAQNYYLAMDQHGRFNPVLWDLNMSFGSFRSSDGSLNFQGMTIEQTKKLDPLQHLSFSISPRPLLKNLFLNDTWKRMYMAHLRTIINEQFSSGAYYLRALQLQQLANASVMADTNKFYSDLDFAANLDTTTGGIGSMIQYVGIRELVEARMAFLSQYPGFSGAPVISDVQYTPDQPQQQQMMKISAHIGNATDAWLYYRYSINDLFTPIMMFDDGLHHDSLPQDGCYGAVLPVNGDNVQFYFYAQNDTSGVFSPERAEKQYFTIFPEIRTGRLLINEIRQSYPGIEPGGVANGTFWLEFFNSSRDSVSTKGLRLYSDEADQLPMPLIDTMVPPGGYLLIEKADFGSWPGLSGDRAGWFGIAYQDGAWVDSAGFPLLMGNHSFGRYPDGTGRFIMMPATPGLRNIAGFVRPSRMLLYPNPAKGYLYAEFIPKGEPLLCRLTGSDGKRLLEQHIAGNVISSGTCSFGLNLEGMASGVYYLHVITTNETFTEKLIIDE